MTTTNHLVPPPLELVQQWQYEANHNEAMFPQVATQAAQWGADQELEVCITWLDEMQLAGSGDIEVLRAARRPKPLSLRAQALIEFDSLLGDSKDEGAAIILRALEALPND
jgi:hypothetical protein